VNDYLILQYAKLIFGLLPAAARRGLESRRVAVILTRQSRAGGGLKLAAGPCALLIEGCGLQLMDRTGATMRERMLS
jgi:hypothetical protein